LDLVRKEFITGSTSGIAVPLTKIGEIKIGTAATVASSVTINTIFDTTCSLPITPGSYFIVVTQNVYNAAGSILNAIVFLRDQSNNVLASFYATVPAGSGQVVNVCFMHPQLITTAITSLKISASYWQGGGFNTYPDTQDVGNGTTLKSRIQAQRIA